MTEGKPLAFNVSGDVLFCSFTLWSALLGPKPALPMDWESDGCSGGAPDTFGRFKLWPACVIHDYHYRYTTGLPNGWQGRKQADDALYWNLHTLVKLQGGGKLRAHRIAWAYWGRVRMWGQDSWQHWDHDDKPRGFWARLREVYRTGK